MLPAASPAQRSNLMSRLGEVLYRLGDKVRARPVLQQAVALDDKNTNAAEWLRLTEASL